MWRITPPLGRVAVFAVDLFIKEEESMTACPVCEADVPMEDDVVMGELIECPECGSELEVVSLDPVGLDEAPEEEEDWGE